MLRSFCVLAILSLLACSKDQTAPIGPVGKINALSEALPAPTNLRVEAITDTSARVAWDAVEGATDYDVNYKSVTGRWTNRPHRGATRTHSTIYALEPDTEYRWAVRSENSDGPSKWVFGENFTTLEAQELIPEPPTIDIQGEVADTTFNIRLSFTDSFYRAGYTEEDKAVIRYAASRWEELLYDIPDWSIPSGWGAGEFHCGDFYIQSTEVDDLSIVVGGLSNAWGANGTAHGITKRGDWRTNTWGLAVEGCVRIRSGLEGERLASVVAHEIGHILFADANIYPPPKGFEDVLFIDSHTRNPYYMGPRAKHIFNVAGGQGNIPMEGYYSGHWKWPLLRNTLMNPHGNRAVPFEITTLDLAALADMGYPVKMDLATPFELD